jgi:aspartyl-tRNA synthetase
MFQGMISSIFKTVLGTDLGEFPVMAFRSHAPLRLRQTRSACEPRVRLTDVMATVDFRSSARRRLRSVVASWRYACRVARK